MQPGIWCHDCLCCLTDSGSRLGPTPTLDEAKMKMAADAMAWYREHVVSTPEGDRTWRLPPNWLSKPREDISARDLEEKNVITIMGSLSTWGYVGTDVNVKVVMMFDTKQQMEEFKLNPNSTKPPQRPLEAFVGLHSMVAAQRLHALHPINKNFQRTPCEVLFCVSDDDSMFWLKYLGTLDNTVKSLHKDMTMWDCVQSLHSSLKYISKQHPGDNNISKRKTLWQNVRASAESSMPYTGGSFITMAQIAQLPPPVWKYVAMIFGGQYTQNKALKGQKTPHALTHFNQMGDIDTDHLQGWLKRVVDGQYTMFQDRCVLYKKTRRVREEIIEYLNVKYSSAQNVSTWEDVCDSYPFFSDETWFANIIAWCPKAAKEKLPAFVKSMIDEKIAQSQSNSQEIVQVSLLLTTHVCSSPSF